jgi:uncharacterized membrane protein YeiB
LIISVALMAVFPIGRFTTTLLDPTNSNTRTEYSERLAQATAEMEELRLTHPHAVGSVREVMAENAHLKNPFRRPLGPESSPAVFAMFLIGLYAGRERIFQDLETHLPLIQRVFRWGLIVGLICMGAERFLNASMGYEVFGRQRATILPQLAGDVLFTYGSTLLALGYAAGITLLAQYDRGRRLLKPLGAAGRLALTVYLSGSLMFGTLFYGFAFGKAFWLGPAAVTGYAVLFFVIQMAFSVWWANRFRFGPTEWFWRGLTYLKLPAMKLERGSQGHARK